MRKVMLFIGPSHSRSRLWVARQLRRVALSVCALALVSGCDYIAQSNRDYRAHHEIPDGSVLVLPEALPIAAGRRDIYLQNGELRPFGRVDRYYPYCEIVLRRLSDAPRSMPAGAYTIHGAGPYIDPHGVQNGTWYTAGFGFGGDPAPSPQLFATRMMLAGPPGSDAQRMVCGAWFDPTEGRYPTLSEIRSALGNFARLELPGAGKPGSAP